MRVQQRLVGGLIVVLVAGCAGTPLGDVTGTVRFKDRPLPSGSVTFLGPDGKQVFSPIAPDGRYSVRSLAPGTARIGVVSHPRVPTGLLGSQKNHPNHSAVTIPERYQNPDTSKLTFEVGPGRQTHDIDLSP